jgi:putative phosphoesterase
MRIAVIADTHDHVPTGLVELLHGAGELWHLGDVCQPEVLDSFAPLGVPLRVVRGNNDWETHWPLTLTLERASTWFHLVHIPPRRAPVGVTVVLHGHTHAPRDETDSTGVRWLNPGCLSRPARGTTPGFAWLEIGPGSGEWRWRPVCLATR